MMDLQEAFVAGMKEGFRCFAWWKDGVEYVGCGAYTLEQALQAIDNGDFDEEAEAWLRSRQCHADTT